MCLLDVLINDSVEVDEEVFQGIESPCEHIFSILGIGKYHLDEVALVIF
jgi:hypothetical protein